MIGIEVKPRHDELPNEQPVLHPELFQAWLVVKAAV
jgi:hypothetical protein